MIYSYFRRSRNVPAGITHHVRFILIDETDRPSFNIYQKMKLIVLVLVVLGLYNQDSIAQVVESKVFSYSKAKVEKTESGEKRELISGVTTHLKKFEIFTNTIQSGKAHQVNRIHADCEEFVFVKEGTLKINFHETSKTMGAGSVALMMPEDAYTLENTGKSDATYYVVSYQSIRPINLQRGINAGGSILLDWDSIKFTPHDRGGVRKFFDRKSAMSERIEMHATTLNPAIKSHEPHTHLPDEIVIMMEGTTEEEIGTGIFKGKPGDVYFMGSNIPHAIRNTGKKPCMYLAFQWE